ncbi:hypothetical protein [Streptomyces specialis]|uniref:hypothetical protein n=1 Tax=Streptomyces specialis TaxID=498367 RepID=UPI000B0DB4D5|nr:hypothetical protein [Streptomyces specialis]
MITFGRIVALVVGVATVAFLFLRDNWRTDNLFLVPDLILSLGLVLAAAAPRQWARTALLLTLGIGAGVLMTSVSAYAVQGEIGLASLAGAVACAVGGLLLIRRDRQVPRGNA